MELVEGEGLDEVIARGPVPMDEAIPIALQIAEALETAHEAGIVHRDLKPANVKIRPDGTVKVLDFGLAKAWEEGEGADLSLSPTLTRHATGAGVILGTAAYMSPEQAKGKPVDRRADIWAFGAVLWEMLTGRKLFDGETASEMLAAVLKDEVDWTAVPSATPPHVARVLRRCLERDPRRRLRDIGDARLELAAPFTEVPPPAPATSTPSGRWQITAAFIAGMFLTAAAAWFVVGPSAPDPPPVTRFSLHDIGMPVDAFQGLAISPDGRRLVFRARDDHGERLHVRALDSFVTESLPGTEFGWLPFFSPGGDRLGFFAFGNLQTLELDGGMIRTVAPLGTGFAGATWLDDDTIVFAGISSAKLGRVPADGGEVTFLEIPGLTDDDVLTSPSALPGGRAVLVGVRTGTSFDVAALDLDDGSLSVIAENGFNPTWSPTGHVLYQQGNDGPLTALPFDAGSMEVTGSPFPVMSDLGPRVSYQVRPFAISGDGTLAYIPSSSLLDLGALVWVDPTGAAQPIVEIPKILDSPRLSPDGRRVAFRTPAPNCDIWVHDLERGTTTRVTHEGDNHGVVWSPDGHRLVFARHESPEWALMTAAADGTGEVERLTPPDLPRAFVSSISPDGEFVLVETRRDATGLDVDMVSVREHTSRPLFDSRFEEQAPSFSPDGSRVAYVSNESGRHEVYVQPFPSLDARIQISTDGGTEPVWSPAGDALYFKSLRRLMVVDVTSGADVAFSRPRVVFESDPNAAGTSRAPTYDVAPDGRRFVMVRERSGASGAEINVVRGWFPELEAAAGRRSR